MNYMKHKDISRRDFLKTAGAAGLAAAGLTACGNGSGASSAETEADPAGQMTFRTSPTTGDRVSLLGFGMMRLPRLSPDKPDIDYPTVEKQIARLKADGILERIGPDKGGRWRIRQ